MNLTEELYSILTQWMDNSNHTQGDAANILNVAFKLSDSEIQNNKAVCYLFLDVTHCNIYLKCLNKAEQYKWADVAIKFIHLTGYNLNNMIEQRVLAHPDKILFKTVEGDRITNFTYKWVEKRIRQLAALLFKINSDPRVAIFADNNIDSACFDLACLSYDILDTPLNVHFGSETMNEIFCQVKVNIAITDSESRVNFLKSLREKSESKFAIIYTGQNKLQDDEDIYYLERSLSGLNQSTVQELLGKRNMLKIDDPATIMFTSGSTGSAKGVVFTIENIITKRFARAAALPDVGDNELLLCYLPLYHTFGRYLELIGMIYWGGTYVFVGNPSIETLISMMQRLNPTGLISIPLRWSQIREKFIEDGGRGSDKTKFRKIVGKNLRWGLSAAGYLDPKVFIFFQEHDVELCSGFGMTEATGGISMTPPGEYKKNSVGIPLPGVKIRITEEGELQISGSYIARYLDEDVKFENGNYWLATGDLFKIDSTGHLYIIDRIKDIYKNNKGQTIAPLRVEKLFHGVPGFKRTFLVGDGMAYNTLLIVPDLNDPVLHKAASLKKLKDYYLPVIASANKDIATYERIVDFTILDRDFEEGRKELTHKGTYSRKVIEANFSNEISKMYKSKHLEFKFQDYKFIIPRWLIRDLGITDYDIKMNDAGLHDNLHGRTLPIKINYKADRLQVGSFEYIITDKIIDLGIFTRQPLLWAGNISLINFSICKDGWDIKFDNISTQVFLTPKMEVEKLSSEINISDVKLKNANDIITKALFGKKLESLSAVYQLESMLHTENYRITFLIRRRLESLALHNEFEVRSLAYRILLFDEPRLDYSKYLPAFISSGLPFLDRSSIDIISRMSIEKGRLDAFRQRLDAYRRKLEWPATPVTIMQFKRVLELLFNFAKHDKKYYPVIREELVCWILHKHEPALSSYAQKLYDQLAVWFESTFELTPFEKDESNWKKRVIFQEGITENEIAKIEKVCCTSTFLKDSLYIIYEIEDFHLKHVPENGIWISKIISPQNTFLFKVSLNTIFGDHYDLMLLIKDDINRLAVRDQIYWSIKLSGSPYGTLPKFGNYRSDVSAISLAYVNELSVWDKIRDLSSSRSSDTHIKLEHKWRNLFVRSFSAFFKAWYHSGKEIIPGVISSSNVVVPDSDIKENSRILSLSGWQKYKTPAGLIAPIIKNFYMQIMSNYPINKTQIKINWLFDSIIESLDKDEATAFIQSLKNIKIPENSGIDLNTEIDSYIQKLGTEPFIHLAVINAVERYNEWVIANPDSTPEAKEQFIKKLYWLYHLERFPEVSRYVFYRDTYFSQAKPEIKNALDNLISAMFKTNEHATRQIELFEFQDTLVEDYDRIVLSKMLFPDTTKPLKMEVISVGDEEHKDIIVKTAIKDNAGQEHIIRKAISPFEVGSLYRLFILDDYPVTITSENQFFVLTDIDTGEEVNGGICYSIQEPTVAHLEGIIISSQYRGKGIGKNLLEDFCSRLQADGIKVLTTHYYLTSFFEKFKFKIDSRWGGLVRFLSF